MSAVGSLAEQVVLPLVTLTNDTGSLIGTPLASGLSRV